MDRKTTHNLTEALAPWVKEAIAHIKPHQEHWAEIVKCMNGNGDVRVVFHARANCITVEVADYDESTVAEVFREFLVPPGGSRLKQ